MGDWRKSTYSDATGGNCVEVTADAAVMVRDTAQRDGVTLQFSAPAWRAFLVAQRNS
jgi:hypothetical protein